jgi:hypothetical protein
LEVRAVKPPEPVHRRRCQRQDAGLGQRPGMSPGSDTDRGAQSIAMDAARR